MKRRQLPDVTPGPPAVLTTTCAGCGETTPSAEWCSVADSAGWSALRQCPRGCVMGWPPAVPMGQLSLDFGRVA